MAAVHWLKECEGNGLERTTLGEYRRHVNLHIDPFIGPVKLSRLTAPMVSEFRTKLREGAPAPGQEVGAKRSPVMVKKIMTSLSSLLADAHEAGYVAQKVARSLTSRKKRKSKAEQKRKLRVGEDIPTPAEVKAIVNKLEGRWRPLFLVALFGGLRSSELRGLVWPHVDLEKGEVHIRQRADRYHQIGAPKSAAGDRVVPLTPMVMAELLRWKLACPPGQLVFPNGAGRPENWDNIVKRGWIPVQIAAGVCTVEKDEDGKVIGDASGQPVRKAKYPGLHSTTHFYASWLINSKTDGGCGLSAKAVQERLGHSSVVMTLDVYGHMFRGAMTGRSWRWRSGTSSGSDLTKTRQSPLPSVDFIEETADFAGSTIRWAREHGQGRPQASPCNWRCLMVDAHTLSI